MASNLKLTDKMSVGDYEIVYRYIEKYGIDELTELHGELSGEKCLKRNTRTKLRRGEIDIDLDPQVLYQFSWYLNYFLAKTRRENPIGIISARPYLLNLDKLNDLGVTDIRLMHGNELGFRNSDFFLLDSDCTYKTYSNAPITYFSNDDPYKRPFSADIVVPTPSWKLEANIQNNHPPFLQLTTKSILTPITGITRGELYSLDPPKSFLKAREENRIIPK